VQHRGEGEGEEEKRRERKSRHVVVGPLSSSKQVGVSFLFPFSPISMAFPSLFMVVPPYVV
jgi:hypothetical protein